MWQQIIGHRQQIEQLKRALQSERVANAYLFHGPRGVGKRLVANNLAQVLACEGAAANEWEACGACAGCRKAAAGNHADLFVVEPEESAKAGFQSIKIGPIRKLQAALQFHPLESQAKLAIIDDADRMMDAAANSLLKILEEPPAQTHFILITSLPHRLLPTIRSRCQHIAFGPLPEGEIARLLTADDELPEEEARRIARLSGGSMGIARLLEPEFVESILGRFFTLTKKASSADILETAEAWKAIDSAHTPLVFDLLASWYRDLLRYHVTGDVSSLIHPEAQSASTRIPITRAERCLAEVANARRASETTANKQLMFEQLLFTLTA